jgi:hypothetical protein
MTLLQWMKRQRTAQQNVSKNKEGTDRRRRLLNTNRSETTTTDETLSSTTIDDVPWRVENFLPSGAPQASDWWDSPADGDDAVDDVDDSLSDERNTSSSLCVMEDSPRFHNCGLDAWNQGRSAWRSHSNEDTRADTPSERHTLSKVQKRDLKRGLCTGNTFLLKQPVGLKDMIQLYNEVWDEEAA